MPKQSNNDNSTNKSSRSSRSNNKKPASRVPDDLKKEFDLTSKANKKILEEKEKGEKKVTKEVKEQLETQKKVTKEKEKQLSIDQKVENIGRNQNKLSRQMKQMAEDNMYSTQAILKYMDDWQKKQEDGNKDQEKFQKEQIKHLNTVFKMEQDRRNESRKQGEEQGKLEDEIEKTKSDALKDLYRQQQAYNDAMYKSQKELAKLQEDINSQRLTSEEEIVKLYNELADKQDEIVESQRAVTKEIEKQKKLEEEQQKRDETRERNKKQQKEISRGYINTAASSLGIQNNDIFKYFSGDMSGFENSAKELGVSAKSLAKSAAIQQATSTAIGAVFSGLKKLFEIWFGRFRDGIDKIYNKYEETYSQISVLSKMNQQDYRDWQNNTVALLQQQGLDNNIAITTMMSELTTAIQSGVTDINQAETLALQNSMTKVIAPYLETTSDAYQDLQIRLGPQFSKNISSMASAVSENVGQSRLTVKNLNSMIEQLEPLSINAKSEVFDKQFAEQAAILEGLVKNGDITSSMAEEIKQKVYNAAFDQYGTLQNGAPAEIASIQSMYNKGLDPAQNIAEYMKEYLGTVAGMMDMADSSGPTSTLNRNVLAQVMAGSNSYAFMSENLTKDLPKIFETAENAGNSLKNVGDELYDNLKNDRYTTETQQKEIWAENISTSAATFKEAYPDAFNILSGIAGTLGQILMAIIGGKLLDIIGKGVGKLFGLGSTAGKAGFLSNFVNGTTGTVGGAIGNAMFDAGANLGAAGSSTLGAQALGVAGVAGTVAGGAMAVKGGMDVYNDFKNDDVSWKTGASAVGAVGGAVGAGALTAGMLGAGAAAGPIGWIALAVGGVALGARAIGETFEKYNKSMESQVDALNEQVDQQVKEREVEQRKQMSSLQVLRASFDKTVDSESGREKIKNELIKAGIATQEELNKEQYNSKQALLDLTDQYIESTKKFSESSNKTFSELEKLKNKDKDPYIQNTKEWMQEVVKGMGQKKMYQMDDTERATTETTIRAMYDYMSQNENSLDDNQKKIFQKMKDNGMTSAYSDINWEQIDAIVDEMDWHKTEMNNTINSALANDEILQKFTTGYGAGDWTQSKIKEKIGDIYVPIDSQAAQSAISALNEQLINDKETKTSKSTIEGYIEQFKNASQKTSLEDLGDLPESKRVIEEVMKKYGIESYKIGSNYIPFNQLALLHKGESVLTAETTSDIKQLLDTSNIKDWRLSNDNLDRDIISHPISSETAVSQISSLTDMISSNVSRPIEELNSTISGQADEIANSVSNAVDNQYDSLNSDILNAVNTLNTYENSLASGTISSDLIEQTVDSPEMNSSSIEVVSSDLSSGFSSLSTVITSQTEALVNKLDEVINAVYSAGSAGQSKISTRQTSPSSFALTSLK